MLDEIDEESPEKMFAIFKLMRLIVDVATLEQELKNIVNLDYNEKKKLAKKLRKLAKELKEELRENGVGKKHDIPKSTKT